MHHRHDNQHGVALVLALYLTAALSVIATGLMFLSQVETYSSANYRTMSQARYGAEAGVNKAVYFLLNAYTGPTTSNPTDPFAAYDISKSPVQLGGKAVVLSTVKGTSSNYADASVVAAFLSAASGSMNLYPGSVAYSATATMLAMRQVDGQTVITWQITGDGVVAGARPATVEVTATLEKQVVRAPGNAYAAFATSGTCGALDLNSSTVNSYDSTGMENDDDRWDPDDRDHDGWRDHDRDHDGWRDDDHDHDGWDDNDDDRDGWDDREESHGHWNNDDEDHAAYLESNDGPRVVFATYEPPPSPLESLYVALAAFEGGGDGGHGRGRGRGHDRGHDDDHEYARTPPTSTSGGDVGTNGNLNANNSATINGTLSTPRVGAGNCNSGSVNAQTMKNGARVTGGLVNLSQAVKFTTPTPTGTMPTTSSYNLVDDDVTLTNPTGNRALGNVHLTNHSTLTLQAGTYNFNSLELTNDSEIVIASGPVTINIIGTGNSTPLQLNSSSIRGATTGDRWSAAQLTINYAGTGQLQMVNDAIMVGQLNAPNAKVSINSSELYGSVIASTIGMTNDAAIHFDRRLKSAAASTYTVGADMLTSFSWKKY